MLVARFFDVADQSRHLAMLLMLTTAAFRCRPTLAQSFQQRVFRAIVSSSGGSLCAADPPDVTVASTRSAVSCAKMCSGATATTTNKVLQATGCRYFNYKRRVMSGVGADGGTYAGSCELYLSVPKCFGSDAGCTLYQNTASENKSFDSLSDTSQPAQNCSLPFTYNGQLCYQCVANLSISCDIGCFLLDRTWVTCSLSTRSFQAQNVTKSVKISSASFIFRSVNNWIVIQSRVDSSYPMNLFWNSYVNGFGNSSVDGTFWLGLNNMYLLTSQSGSSYRLRIEMLAADNRKWFSIEYATFKVDSPSNNFALRVSNSGIGDAGDALNYDDLVGTKINGMPFSTSDRQNDRCQCSSYYGGGWWFNCCMYGHLNGDSSRGYFYWHPLSELGLSPTPVLQISRMMISSV